MSWKAPLVLVAGMVCTALGPLTAHGRGAPESDLLATIEGLGVCGPIHQVVLNLAPRAGDGSFDTDSMSYEVASPETSGLLMKISNPERFAIADQIPQAVQVFELAGTAQTVVFFWPRPDDGTEAVVAATIEALTPALGEPETLDGDSLGWTTGLLTILVSPPSEGLESSGLVVACTATEDAFFAALEDAEQAGTAAEAVDTSEDDGLPPNPWLDRPIMSVLMSWGAPPEAPIVNGNNVVGLHYRDFLNEFEVPMEGWWWFVDGKAVYVASDFMPPRGSSKASSAYRSFKDTLYDPPPPDTGLTREDMGFAVGAG